MLSAIKAFSVLQVSPEEIASAVAEVLSAEAERVQEDRCVHWAPAIGCLGLGWHRL